MGSQKYNERRKKQEKPKSKPMKRNEGKQRIEDRTIIIINITEKRNIKSEAKEYWRKQKVMKKR